MDEMTQKIFAKHGERLSALEQGQAAHEKRIDENDKLTNGIYELTANLKNLTEEVRGLGEKMETGLREQGQRIGALEKAVTLMQQNQSKLEEHEKRLDAIDKKPGDWLGKATWAAVAIAISWAMNKLFGM